MPQAMMSKGFWAGQRNDFFANMPGQILGVLKPSLVDLVEPNADSVLSPRITPHSRGALQSGRTMQQHRPGDFHHEDHEEHEGTKEEGKRKKEERTLPISIVPVLHL